MPSFNKVILAGHLPRDPETRNLQSGSSVTNFSIAVNRTWKTKDGQKQEEVSFFDCTAWAKTGEIIAQYFSKGKPILIEGRLKQDRWEDDQGNNHNKVHVIIDSFTFLGGGTTNNNNNTNNDIPQEDVPF